MEIGSFVLALTVLTIGALAIGTTPVSAAGGGNNKADVTVNVISPTGVLVAPPASTAWW